VILDIMMPGMDGFQVWMRSRRTATMHPIIVATAELTGMARPEPRSGADAERRFLNDEFVEEVNRSPNSSTIAILRHDQAWSRNYTDSHISSS
jgi:CheY-like chemotaxis protein